MNTVIGSVMRAAPALLALLAMLVHSGSLHCGVFPWDDPVYWNGSLGVTWQRAISWSPVVGNIHPLTMLSLYLDGLLGRGDISMAHVTNVVLHGLNSGLVHIIALQWTRSPKQALLVSVVFACHPIHVETVAWVSERKNLLALLFQLGAAIRYHAFLQNRRWSTFMQVILLFVLAMLSKPSAVSFPLFLFGASLLTEGLSNWKRRALELTPLMIAALIFALITIQAQYASGFVHPSRSVDTSMSLLMPLIAWGTYPMRVLVPMDLSIIHPLPSALTLFEVCALLVSASMLIVLLVGIQRRNARSTGLLIMYTATVLPVLQLVPFGSMITADRYAYFAVVPILIALGAALSALSIRSPWTAVVLKVSAPLLIIGATIMTIQRTRTWCAPRLLFEQAAQRYPESAMAFSNLGALAIGEGRYDRAKTYLERAIKLDPDHVEALLALGQIDMVLHQYQRAVQRLTSVIERAPDHPRIDLARLTRAKAYRLQNEPVKALGDLTLIPGTSSLHPEVWSEKGLCHAMNGSHEEAIAAYRNALELGAKEVTLPMNMAISLGWTGRYAEAIDVLNPILRSRPTDPQALYLRGIALLRTGKNGCEDLYKAGSSGHTQAQAAMVTLCGAADGPR